MGRIAVVYWSGTGNTEAMAQAVAKGCGGELFAADEFDAARVADFDALAFGCPSMGAEQLEESEFEPMFEACKPRLKGVRVGLFGSYGWGDGEWMRNWAQDCRDAGAELIGEGVVCMEAPDDEARARCERLGEMLKSGA